jgi:MFS family permease
MPHSTPPPNPGPVSAIRPAAPAGPRPTRWVERATLPVTLLVQSAVAAAILAPAVAAPRMLPDLGMGPAVVGIYIAIVYLGAMGSSQWGAALVKRWGPIRTSQVALAACALGLLLVGVPHALPAIAGALLLGIGYGPITPASSEMLARTTPPERYSLVFSVKQTGVPLGGALAGLMVPVVLNAAGTVWSLAQIALLCVLGVALAAPLRAGLDALRDPASPLPTLARTAQPVRFVLAHPLLRRIALCTLVFSTVQVSLTSFLVSFLNGELHWTLVAAGAALSASQAAGVVGRIAWGLLADRWRGGARLTLLALACAMAAAGVAMLLLRPDTTHAWAVLLLVAYGATAIGWNGVYLATVARSVPHGQAAMATAGSLFFTYFGVVIGPPLFGWIGSATGSLAFAFALLTLPLAWTVWALAMARPAQEQAPSQNR